MKIRQAHIMKMNKRKDIQHMQISLEKQDDLHNHIKHNEQMQQEVEEEGNENQQFDLDVFEGSYSLDKIEYEVYKYEKAMEVYANQVLDLTYHIDDMSH